MPLAYRSKATQEHGTKQVPAAGGGADPCKLPPPMCKIRLGARASAYASTPFYIVGHVYQRSSS